MAANEEISRLLLKIIADTKGLRVELDKGKNEISNFVSGAKKLFATIGISFGMAVVLREMKELLNYFIEYNSEIEQSILGISALVGATTDIVDNEGKILEGQEKFNAALEIGENIYRQLQLQALTTAATTPEIVRGFQSMVMPARKAGMNFDQILKLSIAIVQAMQAANLPMIQMRLESRALIEGEENMRADLMKNLDIRAKTVHEMREQGKLYEFLMDRLKVYSKAGEHQLKTWQGLKSSVKDMVSILGALATEDFFGFLTDQLRQFLTILGKAEDGVFNFSDGAIKAANYVKNFFKVVEEHFKAFGEHYKLILRIIGEIVKAIVVMISGILTGLTTLWTTVSMIARDVLRILDIATFHKIPALGKAFKIMADEARAALKKLQEQARATFDLIFGDISRPPKNKLGPAIKETGEELDRISLDKIETALGVLKVRLDSLRVQFLKITDPIAAARLQLDNFIKHTMEGVKPTKELEGVIGELRNTLNDLITTEQNLAKEKALEKYELQLKIDQASEALEKLNQKFEDGKVSIKSYYENRRKLLKETYDAEVAALIKLRDAEKDEAKKLEITTELEKKNSEYRINNIKTTSEETDALKALTNQRRSLNQAIADMKADIAIGEEDEIRAQHEAELVGMENHYEEMIELVNDYYAKKEDTEANALEQSAMLKDIYAARDIDRTKKIAKMEKEIQLQKLANAGYVVSEMGDIFGQLYEQSGKKVKEFFYLQKAFAVAEAIISTYEAYTKALGQSGPLGIPMANIVLGLGMAKVALIAAQRPAYKRGGLITEGQGGVDDVPIYASRNEYIQPESAVRYYGVQTMEAIRRLLVPKELLQGFKLSGSPTMAMAGAAQGGLVGNSITKNISVSVPITVDDQGLANRLRTGIEKTVISILRDYS